MKFVSSTYGLVSRRLLASIFFIGLQASILAQNVTTTGGKADHLPKFATSTAVMDSSITEAGGKVGIGVNGTPGSTLTVNGEIQSLSGGVKFPDGSTQSTAGISAVRTDPTLLCG